MSGRLALQAVQARQAWRSIRTPFPPRRFIVALATSSHSEHAPVAATRRLGQKACFTSATARATRHAAYTPAQEDIEKIENRDVQSRVRELVDANIDLYPRWNSTAPAKAIASLVGDPDSILPVEPEPGHSHGQIQVSGRIVSIRSSGSKLIFIDLDEGGHHIQLVLSRAALPSNTSDEEYTRLRRLMRRGDYISVVTGPPYYNSKHSEVVSVKAAALPIMQTYCLPNPPIPEQGFVSSPAGQANFHPRHEEMFRDKDVVESIRARSTVIATIRDFFQSRQFTEVQTPVLSAAAGGATARPFNTAATEFIDTELSLRIAPELWLKRLIIGGMDRVFEIGPCFRNEGLDKTHNPEFTTCEFYATRHDLAELMRLTESLILNLSDVITRQSPLGNKEYADQLARHLKREWKVLDFIPTLNARLKAPLPDLGSPSAVADITNIFETHNIPLPSNPTLPRLLDALASELVEPDSMDQPLWIRHIPECLSPLAKSFRDPETHQWVSARAELFVKGREVVNCYEEENSPFEQRRKFVDQQVHAKDTDGGVDEEAMKIDESYIEALEWGLPPTGGWGCGVDRLVMLFTGRERIGDVLSFGNLRSVVREAHGKSL